MNHTTEYVQTKAHKIYSHELVSLIFELPYCRIQDVRDRGIVERQAASRYLKELANLGILKETAVGREKLFIHPKFLNLLSDDTNGFQLYSDPSM